MSRALATLFLFASLVPAQALAQTLTIEVEGVFESSPAPLRVAPAAVVVVRPLEDERAYDPSPRISEPPLPSVYVRSAPLPVAVDPVVHDEPLRIEAWGGMSTVIEQVDLSGINLTLGDPEVGVLRGLHLSPGWAGNDPLREALIAGAQIHLGMRTAGVVRGPELRLFFGGGDVEGEYHPVDGAPVGMELAMRSVFMVRLELALGLQVELGPMTPYIQAIGSVGGAWIDVAVRDAGLGALGSETIATPIFGAGLEGGIDVPFDEGIGMTFGIRANLVGTPSIGGTFGLSWGGE